MSGHKILAPHKEQNGWVYVRVPKSILSTELTPTASDDDPLDVIDVVDEGGDVYLIDIAYFDDRPGSRIISSRRAEQDVETGDFLRLCADEGLEVRCGYRIFDNADLTRPLLGWVVWDGHMKRATPPIKSRTLREAYYRYRAGADAE